MNDNQYNIQESPESLMRIARKVHDEYIEEGLNNKTKLINEANTKAENIINEAKEHGENIKNQYEKEHQEAINTYQETINTLNKKIKRLQEAEEEFSKGIVNLINSASSILESRFTEDDEESPEQLEDTIQESNKE